MKQKLIYILTLSITSCVFFFSLFSYLSVVNPQHNMFAAMNSKTSGPLHSFLNAIPFFQQSSLPVTQTTIMKQTKTIYQSPNTTAETTTSYTSEKNVDLGNTKIQGSLITSGVAQLDGGISTNGGNIDLENGEIKASNIVYGLQAGTGTQITDGQWPTINNTGVLSLQGDTGDLDFTAGSGISIDGLTITNDDTGSSQNIFKNIEVPGQTTIVAGSNNDTLSFEAGTGISLSTATNPNSITISSTGSSNGGGWTETPGIISEVNSSDWVGIGTSNPTAALDIAGTASMSGNLTFRGALGNQINLLNGSSLGIYNSVGGDGGINTNSPTLYINGQGDIGIGTNVIPSLLTLGAPSSATNPALDVTSLTGASSDTIYSLFNGRAEFGYDGASSAAFMQGISGKALELQTNGANTQLFIGTNGNVGITNSLGIGTQNPSYPLDVATNGDDLYLGDTTNTQVYANFNGRAMVGWSSVNAIFQSGGGHGMQFQVSSNTFGSGTTAINISSSGYVGVGTTNEGNGELVVNQAGAGDIFSASSSGSTKFRIDTSGDLVLGNSAATTTLGGIAYTWPTSGQSSGYVLSTNGSGLLSWAAQSGGTGSWQLNSGALSPANITNDLLLGGTSTASATFAVTNIAAGTPQASMAGNLFVMPYTNGTNELGGKVGIDTTNPNATVQIGTNANDLYLGDGTNTSVDESFNGRAFAGWTGVNALFQSGSNHGMQFIVNSNTFGTGTASIAINSSGFVGVGTTNMGNGELVVNQTSTGNVFSASASGSTVFNIDTSGNVTSSGNLILSNSAATTTFGGIAYSWPTSGQSNGYVLSTNGTGALSWTANGSGVWQLNSGALSPLNITNDLLLGSTSTASAAFAVTNLAGGTPQASIAGNLIVMPYGSNLTGGKVGIDTTNPTANLQVAANQNDLYLGDTTNTQVYESFNGRTFAGWTSVNSVFQSGSNHGMQFIVNSNTFGTGTASIAINSSGFVGVGTTNMGNGELVVNQPTATGNIFSASASGTTVFNIDNSGNTRVTGSLCVKATYSTACAGSTAGTIYAANTTVQSADVAENYVSSQSLTPGTVIMPAGDGDNQAIIDTTSAYQSQTIGIISTNPGVTLNSDATTDATHPNKYPVALQGRVPVKVSSINGNITAGDLLTTSSIPGVAMKATQAGQIIGKALESYSSSDPNTVGEIMVFVNISYADPNMQIALTNSGDLSVNGQAITNASTQQSSSQQNQTGVTNDQFTNLSTTVSDLQDQVSSMSSQLSKIDDLTQEITDLQKEIDLTQLLNQTSSQSAVLGAATTNTNNDMTVDGALNVIGKTVLNDVGITGTVTDGLLTINGLDTSTGSASATINTASAPLRIQSLAASGVDFENGKITIDTSGNLQVNAQITAQKYNVDTSNPASASTGEATIPAGQTSIDVKTSAVTSSSNIFTSPEEPLDFTIGITSQKSGVSFTAKIPTPSTSDIKFKWWIVN